MPLLVFGARQVGKSTTIFEFGKAHYSNVVVFNFEHNKPLHEIFEKDLDPVRIVRELTNIQGQSINEKTTLIFFDEVQTCPKALTSLKYFCEQAPNYNIIAAGSLLGVAVNRKKAEDNGTSFPVGKVEQLTMYPMTFEEFLFAKNPHILESIKECYLSDSPLPMPLHEKALELYRAYLFTGGMPKAVYAHIHKDGDFVRFAQNEVLSFYSADMAKYTTASEQIKIASIYDSIPYQLAKDNRKFQYSLIGSTARAVSYELGLAWLKSAGIVIQCNKVREGKIPLAFYADGLSYKIYMSDVGLLNAKGNVPESLILSDLRLGGEAKGAMAENYVAQELIANGHKVYYWESGNQASLDFVIQIGDDFVPVEVKSKDNVQAKSLNVFVNKYKPAYSIRVSSKNFGFENGIKSVPLYAVFCIKP